MREIKFRGQTVAHFPDDKNNVVIPKGKWIIGGIAFDEDRVWIDMPFYGQIIVDKNTVGQYTGLKDKNGKEIYEGDILKLPVWLEQDDENEKCICVYAEEHQTSEIIGFGLYLKNAYSGEYQDLVPSDEWDEFEVVGNIYDNPELLKEAKDEI